jgi:hypothetical protein
MDEITLQDIIDQLNSYDWTHDYSDDHRVWERGAAHRKKIVGMMQSYVGSNPTTKQEFLDQLLTAVPEKFRDGTTHKEIGHMVNNVKWAGV